MGKSKPQHRIPQFPNLVFSDESFTQAFVNNEMCGTARTKMFDLLAKINTYGTNTNVLGKHVEHTKRSSKLIELKFKGRSKTEWRFLFKHLGDGQYAFIHFFLKKDKLIRERDFEAGERIAKREGW